MVTASARVRAELQAYASNDESWGDHNNIGVIERLDDARGQYVTKALTGDYTLDVQNYIEDEARAAMLRFTGAGPWTVTVPAVSYWYIVKNDCSADLTIKPLGGTGSVVRAGKKAIWFTDGTTGFTVDPVLNDILPPTAAIDANGQKIINQADGTNPQDSATVGQLPGLVQPYVDAAEAAADAAEDAQALAEDAEDGAAISETQAGICATAAAASAAQLIGTSTTSLAIGTASKAWSTQTGKFFAPGTRLLATSDADPAGRSMFGIVTGYSGGTVTVAVSATVGAGTYADWTLRVAGERGAQGASGASLIYRSARTSNAQLSTADNSTLIDITSGTFTQTFAAAVTLGVGWWCRIRNAGTGDITLDPSGSETIDGMTSFIMYPGEIRDVICDGFGFYSAIVKAFSKTFTASGTFVKPPGYPNFEGIGWGAGGGGGNFASSAGAGGGGAAATPFSFLASQVGASETVTIAAASAASANGGSSSFGALITFFGGGRAVSFNAGGGGGIFAAATSVTGGSPRSGATNQTYGGGDGSNPALSSIYGGGGGASTTANPGGRSFYGGGGGGATDNTTASAGGVSTFGGNGGAATVSGTGANGADPGGGGGGGNTGGGGGRGELRIWGA